MRWICLLAVFSLGLMLPVHAGHKPPQVFLRVFVQTSGEGMPSTEATQVNVPPNNETIMIRSMPELTEAELTDAHADAGGNIHFLFNHEGQVSLDAFTGDNQGRIMVVMIDGYVVYAPTIDEQLSTGELILPHPIPPVVLQLLQETAKQNNDRARKA